MSPFRDHQPCPALHQWLLPTWTNMAVAVHCPPPGPRWRPPRALRRLLERSGIEPLLDAPAVHSLDALVVFGCLLDPELPLDAARWDALRPGGSLVDLASAPRRRPADWLRPWAHTQRLREAAVMRVRRWLDRGAYDPEQWVTVDPADVVVTIVRRAA